MAAATAAAAESSDPTGRAGGRASVSGHQRHDHKSLLKLKNVTAQIYAAAAASDKSESSKRIDLGVCRLLLCALLSHAARIAK